MKEEGIPFGGEMSGHLFFFDGYWGFDDAIYAACKLCEIVSKSEQSLAELVDSLASYPSTPEVRIETTEDRKWKLVEEARETFGKRYDIVDIDGVRVAFDEGWALLRASNTQPVVVLRAEGNSESGLAAIKGRMEEFLAKRGVEEIPWGG
jgi:phosphomannomutase/phosphoglucomutase